MRATGIVRRIDDLGRIVIPKEIRQYLKIREGDPLEIFTENNSVIFKRYAPTKMNDFEFYKNDIADYLDYMDKYELAREFRSFMNEFKKKLEKETDF